MCGSRETLSHRRNEAGRHVSSDLPPAGPQSQAYAPVGPAANRATCWVVIPVKPPGEGKTRLAGVLSPDAREALVGAMLDRVVSAALGCSSVRRVFVISSHDRMIAGSETIAADRGAGLNETLGCAVTLLPQPRPDRIIIVPADLPCITAADFAGLADLPEGTMAVASDRRGQGTNALSLPAALATFFRFAFGPGSHERHVAEAHRLGPEVRSATAPGLQVDIDEPPDLALLPDAIAALLAR